MERQGLERSAGAPLLDIVACSFRQADMSGPTAGRLAGRPWGGGPVALPLQTDRAPPCH